ncbi:FKBP-type peptidyl-prolyl cis-trans isomerase [uncultured Lutibacter sp.]|uniref:FKBP-type peptidyl-prolyl cis-trans isomerase n=1 Tax=uncultured Lutibacter sp. TaxID=437739 RepID=UPI00260E65B2|nr:FKBP-type peptidyl-prolyl cis-trans isomerase [uncultured Lutibacter sp.]
MRVIKVLVVCAVVVLLASCNNKGVSNKPLTNQIDSVSYAIGLDMGMKIKANFEEVDVDLFVQGLHNAIDSTNIKIEPSALNATISKFFQKKQQEEMAKQQEAAAKKAEEEFGEVKKEGEKFLEENKTKEGVVTTESGLQYIILKNGEGEKPTPSSRVKVHYHGTLIDGTVFDSSVDKGQPASFGVGQVIKGWTEGLQLMPVGSKFKFFIPQELAYGATPRPGGAIKPFMPLIFEVELIEVLK